MYCSASATLSIRSSWRMTVMSESGRPRGLQVRSVRRRVRRGDAVSIRHGQCRNHERKMDDHLGDDESEIEWRLQPAAPEDESAQRDLRFAVSCNFLHRIRIGKVRGFYTTGGPCPPPRCAPERHRTGHRKFWL